MQKRRYIIAILIIILSIATLQINIKLHSEDHSEIEKHEDILLQLSFLEVELKENKLGKRMQDIFPEGYVFVNALYGLAWCELASSDSTDSVLKANALKEALYAFDNLDSETAKLPFPKNLYPKHGIFYHGWKNYLLSKILSIDTVFEGSELYIRAFKKNSQLIAKAVGYSTSPYLESYEGETWPADIFVAMASLSNHDKLFVSSYKSEIDNWLSRIKERLDPKTNLIPHKVNSQTGESISGARGCSIGLILRMLVEIEPVFANEQFELMQTHFIFDAFGLPSMREYPKGEFGLGDIDSGPVIMGVGFSATIVMIGTLSMYGHQEMSDKQYQTIHAFGFDRISYGQKSYLFGQLPMADAFIAWGRATSLNFPKMADSDKEKLWRLEFHITSILIFFLLWILFFRKALVRYIKSKV